MNKKPRYSYIEALSFVLDILEDLAKNQPINCPTFRILKRMDRISAIVKCRLDDNQSLTKEHRYGL